MPSLLEQIIDGATTSSMPVADLLRLCLRLGRKLRSDTLSGWAEHELNGYPAGATVPAYRIIPAGARGRFQNIAFIQDHMIPPAVLEKGHKHWAETVHVKEPVAQLGSFAYAGDNTVTRRWPGNMVLYYQDKIIDGMSLIDAWQQWSRNAFVGILDTVRTRVLQLAMDLDDEAGNDVESFGADKPQQMQQIIINNLYGPGQMVSIGNENQIQHIEDLKQTNLIVGDRDALDTVLRRLGLDDGDLADLTKTLPADTTPKQLPTKLKNWIGDAAKKAGAKLGDAALDATVSAITQLVKQHLGMP